MHTERTNYNPYQNMELRYVAILWREGPNIRGTIEKSTKSHPLENGNTLDPHAPEVRSKDTSTREFSPRISCICILSKAAMAAR